MSDARGAPFAISGREFLVPRLRIATFETAALAIQAAERVSAEEDPFGLRRLDAHCGAIVELLRENYPDLTVTEVKQLVHLDEVDAVLSGLLRAGGKKPPGEAVAP